MIDQNAIERINELARKARSEGLTEAEQAEQKELRARYVAAYRESMKSQLESIVLVDRKGNKTPLPRKGT